MLLDFIDQKIRKAFSDAAFEYDLLTSLHKEIGRELIKKIIDCEECGRVLDIGMGTGWLTKRIKFYLPESKVVGIDFAEGMLDVAKNQGEGFDILAANALRLPFKENSFDMIVSNLSLQWVKSLDACLQGAHYCLKKDGGAFFTLFGHDTFKELFTSLKQAQNQRNGKKELDIKRLPSADKVKEALEGAGFRNLDIHNEIIKVHFSDMYRLVKWIKDIGANGLTKEMFVGKELLSLANDYYESNFKDKFGIYSTFEVIWARARK